MELLITVNMKIFKSMKGILPVSGNVHRIVLVICTVVVFVLPVNGASENKNEIVLKAVFSEDLKPWSYVKDGKIEGVYPAIISELAKELNIKAEFKSYPIKRCEVLMEQGEADLMIGIKDTQQRKKYIEFLKTPYRLSSAKVFYTRTGDKGKLKRFKDLYNLTVGVELGTKYFPEFDNDHKIVKEYVSNEEQNFYKLIARRIDVLIIPEDRGEFLISTLNMRDKIEKASYRFSDGSPRYIGISKKSPFIKDIKKFDAAMKKLAGNGTLEKLYMKNFFDKYNINVNSFRWR